MSQDINKFSARLATMLWQIEHAGNALLALLVLCLGAMVLGYVYRSSWLFGTGAFLMTISLGIMLYLRSKIMETKEIQEKLTSVDSAQKVALELTRTVKVFQELSFKYIKQVNFLLENVLPLLKTVPVLGRKVDLSKFSGLQQVSQAILETGTKTEVIVGELEEALVEANLQKLEGYAVSLQQITQRLNTLASSHQEKASSIPN